jgi:putative ABC transport system substrate-binding protein
MKRRAFITLIGGTLAAWSLAARAEQPTKAYRIAVMSPSGSTANMSERGDNPSFREFFKELRSLGYVEGENLVVTRYSAEGREDRYGELCQKVVRTKPDVIVAGAARLVMRLKEATAAIPIVATMSDPVPLGIVASISRPGGNITGASVVAGLEIWGKRLELLREAVPTISNVGFLASRVAWNLPQGNALREAAQQLRISLHGPPLESPIQEDEYRRVFAEMAS